MMTMILQMGSIVAVIAMVIYLASAGNSARVIPQKKTPTA